VTVSCERVNELKGYIKSGKFLVNGSSRRTALLCIIIIIISICIINNNTKTDVLFIRG
jgi:hypothetical protein